MKRIKRRMAGIILIVMLLTILLSPGSFSAWADKTDDAADDEFDISAIIDNGDDVIVVPAEDSADPIVPDENITDEESPYKVGDIITFGKYEQDGDIENGKEDIEWQVLKVEEDRVLVVSKYALDCQPYNTEYADVTWESCSLRTWLNDNFKNEAFTTDEQKRIPTISIENLENPKWGTSSGNSTNDQIFCLSLDEMEQYFGQYGWYDSERGYGYNQNLICTPTQYAMDRGAYSYTITEADFNSKLKDSNYTFDAVGQSGSWWWLRSLCDRSENACVILSRGDGGAYYGGCVSSIGIAVRPAMFILSPDINEWDGDLDIEAPIEMPTEEIEDALIPEDEISDVNPETGNSEDYDIEDEDEDKDKDNPNVPDGDMSDNQEDDTESEDSKDRPEENDNSEWNENREQDENGEESASLEKICKPETE